MKKRFISVLLAVFMLFSLAACGQTSSVDTPAPSPPSAPDIPVYQSIDSSEYIRDNKKCIGYRVEIGDGATEEEMREVYEDVIAGDSYYLHTVWFYGLSSDVVNVGSYTVGMLEEVSPGASPVFSLPTYSQDLIESMRARASTSPGDDGSRSIPNPSLSQSATAPDNSFEPASSELFSEPENEDFSNTAFYVSGVVESVSEVDGLDTIHLSTEYGDLYAYAILVPLPEVSGGDELTMYCKYTEWDKSLGGVSAVYVYHE